MDVKETAGRLHYDMMRRCYNPKSVMYKDYGAKGIGVCEEWHERKAFVDWAKSNGYRKGLKLERVDGSKDYSPENCKFGTKMVRKDTHTRRVKNHRQEMKKMAGIEGNYSRTRLYGIYRSMLTRCYYADHIGYEYYGGKGITVCNEWLGYDGFFYFYKWSMENGYKEDLTIDRIDNNGNYCPENCRWTTWKAQANNRGKRRKKSEVDTV